MATKSPESERGVRGAWGIILLVLSVFVGLSVFSYDWRDISLFKALPNDPPCNLIGLVGAWLSFGLFYLMGVTAYLVPFLCVVLGLIFLLRRDERIWPRSVWGLLMMVSLCILMEIRAETFADTCRSLNIPDAGGFLAHEVTQGMLVKWLSPVGTGILAWLGLAVSLVMIVEVERVAHYLHSAVSLGRSGVEKYREFKEERQEILERLEGEEKETKAEDEEKEAEAEKEREEEEKKRRRRERLLEKEEPAAGKIEEEREPAKPAPVPEPTRGKPEEEKKERDREVREVRKKPEPEKRKPAPPPPPAILAGADGSVYRFPTLDLLDPLPASKNRAIKTDTATAGKVLIETLAEFGIEGEVTHVEEGPVVARYEVLPAPGVKVEKIASLSNNLALALKATSVRVQAPIPGKGVVGIEVPNSIATTIYLREMLEGETWQASRAKLPLVLGKDVGGVDIIADLADMPHLLIAGATGTGKTVCMNSVLAGLLMSRAPAQLRLMLVDPKIVEFAFFNDLPHLVAPVITDPKKVVLGLRWAINEMEQRYKLFAKAGVRNIEGFNTRVIAKQETLFKDAVPDAAPKDAVPDRIPYIVIVIDELADLMLTAQADIENCIARLAQLSRAVGIHMILSTQRPSVNVITGTIKANFPARIAFQVAQKVDSRTILDAVGADKLLGRGDMLFQPPGTSKMVRAQGTFTTDAEIRRIVDFIKAQAPPSFEVEIKEKLERPGGGAMDEGDESEELIAQAVEIIRQTQRASTSSLQRRLRIGYTRAARIMDILEERGIVGEARGSDPREILVDLDGEIPDNAPDESEETDADKPKE